MNERELLEKAARVAGIRLFGWNAAHEAFNLAKSANPVRWNPLTDDGDALRLAVKLGLQIVTSGVNVVQAIDYGATAYGEAPVGDDRNAATRLAIVRAAAALAGDGSRQNQVSSMDADRGGERSDAGEAPHG